MRPIKTERRRFPRIEQNLPLKIGANGYDFVTYTHNVSCVGTYCRISKYIPPFTKVSIRLSLPISGEGREKKIHEVECEGVIVRAIDGKDGGFNIAVFFNRIKDIQLEKISQYINQFIPKESSSLQEARPFLKTNN